ncbi:hypothetical protein M407DRAFT_13310, partial [Tulasnella calospora MUT 4182]
MNYSGNLIEVHLPATKAEVLEWLTHGQLPKDSPAIIAVRDCILPRGNGWVTIIDSIISRMTYQCCKRNAWVLHTLNNIPNQLMVCKGLLEDYRALAGNEATVFVDALDHASQTAYALPEPDPEKTDFREAFRVRAVYDDPEVKKLLNSEVIAPKKRLELERVSEDILQQQP